jgi:hypothetical protein
MAFDMTSIEAGLADVKRLREQRDGNPSLGARVAAIKAYQHNRLKRDYIGWLADPRFRPAALFFLDHLYGPHDFTARDAQFARIVPALKRLLPVELMETVGALIELHALTETLDQQMAEQLEDSSVNDSAYRQAWRRVGCASDRERQVTLMLAIGHSLDRHTRRAIVGATLRLMRGPAHAAGLADLQLFLEQGFDAFKTMKGADEFLQTIARNERAQIAALFGS